MGVVLLEKSEICIYDRFNIFIWKLLRIEYSYLNVLKNCRKCWIIPLTINLFCDEWLRIFRSNLLALCFLILIVWIQCRKTDLEEIKQVSGSVCCAGLACLVTVLWMHCSYISIFIVVDVAAANSFQMLVSQVHCRGRCLADT